MDCVAGADPFSGGILLNGHHEGQAVLDLEPMDDAVAHRLHLGEQLAHLRLEGEVLLADLRPESWLYRDVRQRIEEVFLRTDDYAGLAEYYERWLEQHPDDVDAMTRLGEALAVQGRMPEA